MSQKEIKNKAGVLVGMENVYVADGYDLSVFVVDKTQPQQYYKYILTYNGQEVDRGYTNPVHMLKLISTLPLP